MRAAPVALGVALAVAGCARMPVVDDGLGFDRRQAELEAISDWDLRGRLAIDTGEEGHMARFDWSQRGDELELEVSGRLGAGGFRIRGNESLLTVESRGETRILTDPERELSEMLDWWLPVTSAEHWLLGLPDPDYPAGETPRGRFDTIRRLEQRDWQIAFDEYQTAEARLVPRRITLTHAELELRLTVTDFESVTGEP